MKLAAYLALWSSLAALSSAMAATPPPGGDPARSAPAPENLVQLAQARDAEVFYDEYGNRVIIDSQTGQVISVRPPERQIRRESRRERLRELRRRQLEDDGGYLAPEFERYDRPRRYEPEYSGRGNGEEYYPYEQYPEEAAPRRPSQEEYPAVPRQQQKPKVQTAKPLPSRPQPAAPPAASEPKVAEREPANPPAGSSIVEPKKPARTGSIINSEGDPIGVTPPATSTVREEVAALQILLDRAGASSGVIDGRFGSNLDKAIVNYRSITGKNLKSTDTQMIKDELAASGGDPFMTYTITAQDAAGPYVASVPDDYSEKAKLEKLSYTSVPEMLAERFHMDESYLRSLNRDANFNRPGTIIRVANVGKPATKPVLKIIADKANKQVRAYGADGKLVVAYPATIGSTETPSPTGTHAISRIALDPGYTYNPKVNFKQGNNDKILTIPPGPNGPVGSVWIALDKPTYGIHGTPEPSKIGKTESHGCVRLTNWDAAELAKLVKPGVTVEFVD